MSAKKVFYLISAMVTFLVVWLIYESFTQPGVGQLKGEFRELAFYRNENNTGPIKRVYAVYTNSRDWEVLEQYGKFMPHTKYGVTLVYFFGTGGSSLRKLEPSPPHFEAKFQKDCIAVYEKNAMGQESFKIQPFK
jgi:hypothetical protein